MLSDYETHDFIWADMSLNLNLPLVVGSTGHKLHP